MSGWRFRREERDGRIVMVPVYDGGPDEDGRRERDDDETEEEEGEECK